MNSLRHMLVVVGARPQFIKAAALHRVLKDSVAWRSSWVHTGQHHDVSLSGQFFEELELPVPNVTLTPRSTSREWRLGDMMHGIREAIQKDRPDWLLVFGDTDSTLAGAWASAAEGVPLVHVEAGLRSHDWTMPEEVNRVLTDRLSSVLVCPTDAAVAHLETEGIVDTSDAGLPHPTRPRVLRTGDVMHDNAVHFGAAWPRATRGKGKVLITMHRPANVDDPTRLRAWMNAVSSWLSASGQQALFPVHPRTVARFDSSWSGWRQDLHRQGIEVVEPLAYLDLLKVLCAAPLVLTDSGGVQKEAYSMGTRCVVLRPSTEWVEQVDRGHSRLAADPVDLHSHASHSLEQGRFETDDLYGSGQSAQDILLCLEALPQRAISTLDS